MKKFQKIITAFRFEELSDDAKEKAKKEYLDDCRSTYEFSNDLVDYLKATCGLFNLKTYYSLSYCQGDGLCLYGEIESHEIFGNDKFGKIALKGLQTGQIKSVTANLYKIDFKHSWCYYYASRTDIEIRGNNYDLTDKQYELLEKVKSNIQTWYFDFCKRWENLGYEYFYEVSDEEMIETGEANDYFYNEDGKLLNTTALLEVA